MLYTILCDFCLQVEKYTSFYSSTSPGKLYEEIFNYVNGHGDNIEFDEHRETSSISLCFESDSGVIVHVHINLYRSQLEGEYLVEVRRTHGCSLAFNTFYRKFFFFMRDRNHYLRPFKCHHPICCGKEEQEECQQEKIKTKASSSMTSDDDNPFSLPTIESELSTDSAITKVAGEFEYLFNAFSKSHHEDEKRSILEILASITRDRSCAVKMRNLFKQQVEETARQIMLLEGDTESFFFCAKLLLNISRVVNPIYDVAFVKQIVKIISTRMHAATSAKPSLLLRFGHKKLLMAYDNFNLALPSSMSG